MLCLTRRLLLVAVVFFAFPLTATDYLFTPVTDPLLARQSSVYHISQDPDGFMWFGSDTDGLLRFDGNNTINWLYPNSLFQQQLNINYFILEDNKEIWLASWRDGLRYYPNKKPPYSFAIDPSKPNALANHRIQTLFKDSTNRLWVGTIEGLHYIDLDNPYTIQQVAFNQPLHPLYEQRIWGITESPEGLWIATSEGIVLLDKEHQQIRHFKLHTANHFNNSRANEVREIKYLNAVLIAGSAEGIFIFEKSCQCFTQLMTPDNLVNPRVNTLHQGINSTVWVGASNGLYQFDTDTRHWLKQDHSYNFLPNVDVRSLFLDKDKQLWVGSREQGIFFGYQQYQAFKPLFQVDNPLQVSNANDLTSAIYHDTSGGLWLASQNVLFFRAQQAAEWQAIEFQQQFGIRKIYRITEDPSGDIWLATSNGLYRVDNLQLIAVTEPFDIINKPISAVTDLAIDQAGTFYLGLWQFGLIQWQPQQQRAELQLDELTNTRGDQIYQISKDKDNTFYAVSRYTGLFRKSADSSGWQRVLLPIEDQIDGYNCILAEQDLYLWLCSEYGLWRVDKKTQQVKHYTVQDGLPSLFVNGAFFDNENRFWVLTNHGPARFEPRLAHFVSYKLYDGLPSLSMQRNSYSVAKNGEILLGTAKGPVLLQVAPEKERLTVPDVVITSIIIDGIDHTRDFLQNATELALPYSYRELIIRFALIDYRHSETNTTRTRLLGLSNRWSDFSTHHEVRYINLPTGQYTLEIAGQNSRGINTTNPYQLAITVQAPWWAATWIWLVAVLLLFLVTVAFMQLQQAHLNKRNYKLQLLVSQRTSELEALTVRLKRRAEHDSLTGLLNRAGFAERFKETLQNSRRTKQAVSLILVDIDHFKLLNDQYGHDAGDKVLQHFAKMLQERVRSSDVIGRWGGEEFIIVLENCQEDGAKVFCEELLHNLKQSPCLYHELSLYYAATFGIVSLPSTIDSLDLWLKLADNALYKGKAAGRAQIIISRELPSA
ncbi:diguanylate cyclase [Alishewanella sp. d11]|uniref:ligand-binding sensor domain-containing diguanylate cyclase n=1 Tax=Alishewanella sp. d11 TaxID=3414030 RepID=UPI003BF7BD6F